MHHTNTIYTWLVQVKVWGGGLSRKLRKSFFPWGWLHLQHFPSLLCFVTYDENTPPYSNFVSLVFCAAILFGWLRDYWTNNDDEFFGLCLLKLAKNITCSFTMFNSMDFDNYNTFTNVNYANQVKWHNIPHPSLKLFV